MTVTKIGDQHVYQCDLCGCKSTNPYALDLHRKALSGPDDPEVERPDQEVVIDVCHWCRREIRHSHIESRVSKVSS